MDSQRPFLYLTLIFLGFLLWTTWQRDQMPEPVVDTTQQQQTQTAADASGVPQGVPQNTSGDGVPTQTAQAVPNQTQTQQQAVATNSGDSKVSIIRVRTDVLDLEISS